MKQFEHNGCKYNNKFTYTDTDFEFKQLLYYFVTNNYWSALLAVNDIYKDKNPDISKLIDHLENLCLFHSGDDLKNEIINIAIKDVTFHSDGSFTITILFNEEIYIPEFEQDADGYSQIR